MREIVVRDVVNFLPWAAWAQKPARLRSGPQGAHEQICKRGSGSSRRLNPPPGPTARGGSIVPPGKKKQTLSARRVCLGFVRTDGGHKPSQAKGRLPAEWQRALVVVLAPRLRNTGFKAFTK